MHESVRLFDEAIRATGAKTCLYMTWARAHAPDSQPAITDAYSAIAKELNATLIPVGVVWPKFLAKYEEPALHDADGSHPSLAGSYLAACVFAIKLVSRQALKHKVPVTGLTEAHAQLLGDFASKHTP
jgi:hypothetical protein